MCSFPNDLGWRVVGQTGSAGRALRALEDGFGLRLKQAEQIGQPVGGSSYQVGAEHSRGAEEAEDDVRELSDTSLLTETVFP